MGSWTELWRSESDCALPGIDIGQQRMGEVLVLRIARLKFRNIYCPVVTICTAQWSLYVPHSGHCTYHQFNIQQFYVLPTHCIYVFCVDLRTNSDYFSIQHQLTGFCYRDLTL